MLKRVGICTLLLSAIGAAILPKTAQAQDGYYGQRSYYYQGDHDRHEWREQERQEKREREWRDREWREQVRRQEWRERDRWEDRRCYRDNRPAASFYFGYDR